MSPHRRILLSSKTNGSGPSIYCPPLPSPFVLADPAADPPPRHLSNAAIAAVSAVSAAVFLALTYYSVLRHRRRRLSPAGPTAAYFSDDDDDEEFEGGAHHAWNIRTVGIDESAILSIGSYAYLPSGGGNLTAPADCPVCLGEFAGGDMVRLLPRCGHVFHVPCIDTWLRAHVSCPICRAHPLPQEAELTVQKEETAGDDDDARARVLADPEAPPSAEDSAAPENPADPSTEPAAETEMEERGGGEERKVDVLGENSSKELESSSGSGRVFFFARMARTRSSSVLPL